MERLSDWWVLIVCVLIVVTLSVLLIIGNSEERAEWEKFRAAHHCRVVGETDGTTGTGVGITSSGKAAFVSTYEAGKIGWLCDDGITHWRSK